MTEPRQDANPGEAGAARGAADPKRRHVWKFVLIGLAISGISTLLRGQPAAPMSAQDLGRSIGEALSGGLWGWVVWLLWARRWKTLAMVAVALAVFVALVLFVDQKSGFDEAGFRRGCAEACMKQWRQGASDPQSPAYGMTEERIQGLCGCTCGAILSGMSPDLREEARASAAAGRHPSGDQAKKFSELRVSAMNECVPKFLPASSR